MKKPAMLFLDDRTKRINSAIAQYEDKYNLTIVTNVKECLRYLSAYEYAVLSMDCDLGGEDFVDPDSPNSAMELVRYLEKTNWPFEKERPVVIIHSSNVFVASIICERMLKMGFDVSRRRFEYQDE